MAKRRIRIATRKSQLALWQAEHVAARLREAHPDVETELVKMTSKGDKILDQALAKIGGKGLFIKELEHGLLSGEADIAVHSMKDVPIIEELPEGLHVPVVCAREDPRDAFVSNVYGRVEELPEGAVVGTASMRRQCQLLERRPDLQIRLLRGNVNSRLAKLDAGDYDAIILACAGLKRLGFADRITYVLPPEESLPAVGQGAVGIECRTDDDELNRLIAALDDSETHTRVAAERAMNTTLQGGCQVPIAGYAEITDGIIFVRGLVGRPDGSRIIRGDVSGRPEDAEELGRVLGEDLLSRGADAILKDVYAES